MASTGDPDALARLDPGRNVDVPRPGAADAPAPAALLARLLGNLPRAAAGGAGARAHDLPQSGLCHAADLAGPAAVLAGANRGAGLGAVSAAVLAGVDGLEAHLGERDLDLCADVAARGGTGGAEPEELAEEGVAAAEERLEDVLEAARGRARAPATRPQPVAAEGVVETAPLGVGEDLVGLGRLLEALLGVGVARVDVGMQLTRERPERLLDLGAGGGAVHAEDLVVVARHRVLDYLS